jgi:hypothetical protein
LLHWQIFRYFDLGNQASRLRSEHTDSIAMIFVHESVKVRAAEFSTNGGETVPSAIFKATWQDAAMHRSANGSLSPSL